VVVFVVRIPSIEDDAGTRDNDDDDDEEEEAAEEGGEERGGEALPSFEATERMFRFLLSLSLSLFLSLRSYRPARPFSRSSLVVFTSST